MSRIPLIEYETATAEAKREFDFQTEKNGRITNMKRTLLHSLPAYKAYMEWYTLRDEIEPFIGKRGVIIFSHAISSQNDCLICSTFFRRFLIENGENPEDLLLDEQEQVLVAYGRQLVTNSNEVSDQLFARLKNFFTDQQIVLLTAFAGLMIATNLFNNALKVTLDDYLQIYAKNKQGNGE
jgi:hypothetical protein